MLCEFPIYMFINTLLNPFSLKYPLPLPPVCTWAFTTTSVKEFFSVPSYIILDAALYASSALLQIRPGGIGNWKDLKNSAV